ncbi:MAG: hypothetical protein KF823_02675 [Xanthomonadales bacterium]|nr:hypothetical protein [Xanthomonadales bacterium]
MRIDEHRAKELGTALNEASLLGVEYDRVRQMVGVTISVLTLPDDHSPESADPRRQLILKEVGRVAAALRDSRWDDYAAKPLPLEASDLLSTVQSFGGQPIYGWEFINHEDQAWELWKHRLSLDIQSDAGARTNLLALFQEGVTANRHLDLWVWFEELVICDAQGNTIDPDHFVAGGIRWWEAMHAGDPRTQGHGIASGVKDS